MFEPKGDRAQWRIVYDLLRAAAVDTVVTYDLICEKLGLDPKSERHIGQMAARRAGIELEREDGRAVEPVRGEGYRIVRPEEHLRLGRRRNRSAGRQLARGEQVVTTVDLNKVDPETARALNRLAQGFALQHEINRRMEARQNRTDRVLGLLMDRVEDLERKQLGK